MRQLLSCVPLLCDPMDYSPSVSSVHGFSRQEYWSVLPFPSPGDLSYPELRPGSPALQVDSLPSEPPGRQTSPLIIFSAFLDLRRCKN